MGLGGTMGSISRCWKKSLFDGRIERASRTLRGVAMLLWCASLAVFATAYAQNGPAVGHMAVERSSEGLLLDVSTDFSLPALVQEALQQGIPMIFVAEAEVMRARWYWADQKVAAAQRYFRLSYQPLTRRWRLNVASAPFSGSGLGVSVGQTYDELPDVLAVMQRIASWSIADAEALRADGSYRVDFRFQLDLSQLPRPLQIGALGRSGWNLSLARTERVPPAPAPSP